MTRLIALLSIMALTVSACGSGGGAKYRIGDKGKVQGRVLQEVNASRGSSGLTALQLNSQLSEAAQRHSKDMSFQNRPWHWGSDGSSPMERAARAGYFGRFLGEDVSESFEDEMTTLNVWMSTSDTRAVIMDPEARDLGFGWHQDSNGKIWWTLITGG
jgi:uncharacterized protein YkwD